MNEKTKDLEKVGLGFAIMFGIYWIYSIFIVNHLEFDSIIKNIIGLVCLYGLGFSMFFIITKRISKSKIEKKKVGFKTIFVCFLLQFTAIMIMSVVVNVITNISGGKITNEMNMDVLSPFNIFLLLVFNPIIEEFVFRKIFADKLLKHGELFYILTSAFCFAIVHGVAIGLPQVIYTFILGLIWAYLYIKTGKIIIPIILHSISNLFSGIIVSAVQGISQEALMLYSMFMMVMSISGIVCFFVNKKNILIDNENKFLKKSILKDIFTNKGIIVYIVLTIAMFFIKSFVI